MPAPGDVDVVVASELMEAGRAILRGFVTGPHDADHLDASHLCHRGEVRRIERRGRRLEGDRGRGQKRESRRRLRHGRGERAHGCGDQRGDAGRAGGERDAAISTRCLRDRDPSGQDRGRGQSRGLRGRVRGTRCGEGGRRAGRYRAGRRAAPHRVSGCGLCRALSGAAEGLRGSGGKNSRRRGRWRCG